MSRRAWQDRYVMGLWRLDETSGTVAYDVGRYRNDGTISGATPTAVTGKPWTSALDFDRSASDYVSVGDITALEVTNLTVEGWAKPSSWSPSAHYCIAAKFDDSGSAYGYMLAINSSNQLELTTVTAGGSDSVTYSVSGLSAGYHYLMGGYDGTDLVLYIDGDQVATKAHTYGGNIVHSAHSFVIGARSNLNDSFDGELAEIRISNYSRYPWEMKNIYKAVSDFQAGFAPNASTVAYYKFTDDATYVKDEEGNHHGHELGQCLVGHYKMNDTASPLADSSIIPSNDATGYSLLYEQTGKINDCIRLQGTTASYVSIPRNQLHNVGDFTVAFWVKHVSYPANRTIWLDGARSGQPYALILFQYSGTVRITINGTTDQFGSELTDNDWHYIVYRREGTTGSCYIDNVQSGSNQNVGSTLLSIDTGGLLIGQFQTSVGGGFTSTNLLNGYIDDFRIYRRCISTAEMTTLYNSGSGTENTNAIWPLGPRYVGAFGKYAYSTSVDPDYCVVPHHSDFTMTVDKTFQCVFHVDDNSDANKRYIWSKGTTDPYWQWLLFLTTSFNIRFRLLDSNSQEVYVDSGLVPQVGVTYRVDATWDVSEKTLRLYINGQPYGSSTNASITPALLDNTDDMYFGGLYPPIFGGIGDYTIEGGIHLIRIIDEVLTPKEIYDDYHGTNILEDTSADKIHWWKLNGSSPEPDSTGSLDGTVSSADAVDGLIDGGRLFNNNTDYIECGDSSDLRFGSNPFTLMTWAKVPDASATTTRMLLSKWYDTGSKREYALAVPRSDHPTTAIRSKIALFASPDGSYSDSYWPIYSSMTFIDGLYYLFAVTRSGTALKLYVNGALVAETSSCPSTIYTNDAPFVIGNKRDRDQGWRQEIDNVQVYDAQLSASTIEDTLYYEVITIGIANRVPAPDSSEISVEATIDFDITDFTNNVVTSTVEIKIDTASDGSGGTLMYDGDGGGFVNGYSGTYVNTPGSGVEFSSTPPADLKETYIYYINCYAENDQGQILDETWKFDTETLLLIKNSGFEAPNSETETELARYWGWVGPDPSSQLGTKRGRLQTPAFWTPPEGEFVFVLGSTDTTETISTDTFEHRVYQIDINFSVQRYLRFYYKIVVPTIASGITWRIILTADEITNLWTKTYTEFNDNTTETDIASIDCQNINGIQGLQFHVLMDAGGDSTFDDEEREEETFSRWPGYFEQFIESLATTAEFDNDTQTKETFDNWPYYEDPFDEDTSVAHQFDSSAYDLERMENVTPSP